MRDESRAATFIRHVIEEWNPYGLLPMCPDNEFDGEIAAIERGLNRCRGEADVVHLVSRVFLSSFSDSKRFLPEKCRDVGSKLYALLKEKNEI